MTKTFAILLFLGIAGLGCFGAFNIVGSTIDSEGILHEPFFLIPIGALLILVGFGGLVVLAGFQGLRALLQARREN